MSEPVILVHGGAGEIPDSRVPAKLDGVKRAALRGYKVLLDPKCTVMDAVEAAVMEMEDDPAFNTGYGSVLTDEGTVEMDALIVDGPTLRAGAVGCVRYVAHPISLARMVMEHTDHVMLAGEGAEKFAKEMGVELLSPAALVSPDALHRFQQTSSKPTNELDIAAPECKSGTVGAVAVDLKGQLASATSTGGMSRKKAGRIGDTPVIGSGGYADEYVSISATGVGESLMRVCLSRRIAELVRDGEAPKDAILAALDLMTAKVGGDGGAIVVTNDGQVGYDWNSRRMSWAYCKSGILYYGIAKGDVFREDVHEK